MLTIISLINIALLVIFVIIDYRHDKDHFSAVKISSYFLFLPAVGLFLSSFSSIFFASQFLESITIEYWNTEYIKYAYFLFTINIFFSILGTMLGSNSNTIILPKVTTFFFYNKINNINTLARFCFLFGIILYVIFIFKIGGLINLWENSYLRTQLTAGLGYYQVLYTFFLNIACCLSLTSKPKPIKNFEFIIYLVITVFVLVSLLQRSPVITLLFALIVTYNFSMKPVKLKIGFFNFILLSFLLIFTAYTSEFRGEEITIDKVMSKNPSELIVKNVFSRLTPIDRYIVSVGYVDKYEYWYGSSYLGLLTSFIPRGLYPDKPPIDTGVYIEYMKTGEEVNLPLDSDKIPVSSSPPGILSGYLNFGIVGIISLSFISGFVFGYIYFLVKHYQNILLTIFFGLVSFMGYIPLSPMGIVKLAMLVLSFGLFSIFVMMNNILYNRGSN
ncbi:O-antigen polymerase [Vibrio breoganii]|uniref:O-antigen polymerase n=1 Tax=Vibrio breoganii TaxID=553239 RepID=UPI000C83FE17|nr:O-antigen polymerase [Vibrio breoganii]PMM86133.1 hypothetical protein BCT44_06865 [Vibrio breoganii]